MGKIALESSGGANNGNPEGCTLGGGKHAAYEQEVLARSSVGMERRKKIRSCWRTFLQTNCAPKSDGFRPLGDGTCIGNSS